ncbi:Fatty acid oxidation complex subunit alpha [Rosistilla carotiformis]|uniref:Fatty acid oxidation complex subunit alpha n=1 Tax=Rosistilla carotiformis TaxID=2528017 RepID=A0A518JRW8_9BACT|nr:3-hydroxyacyl-CoA dehydrogenase family protein [Rosistilla carotiformis]QDV68284.1 Fatty acid oxidation complex subunit alpha [Rosistilla carotiformis]
MNDQSAWDISLIGAGIVGRAIASDHLQHGLAIRLIDSNPQQLAAAVDALASQSHAAECPPKRWGDACWATELLPNGSQRGATPRQSIVIESIVERREPKQQVLALAEQLSGDDAILATNTSTIPLADVTQRVLSQGRCCGLHFFMPVDQRPLIEIITGDATSEATVAIAKRYAAALGKQHLIVRDAPGFVVNRMLVPYLNESVQLLCSGTPAEQIQRVATENGMPMSPLELMDWIGMETGFHAGRAIWQAFPSRIEPSPLTPAMVKAKLPGRAGGEGFYVYKADQRSATLGPTAQMLVERYTRETVARSDAQVAVRLFFPMLIEAACILLERVVGDLDSIERAFRGGLGFRDANGFIHRFDAFGNAQCLEELSQLSTLGRRFTAPPELLAALQATSSTTDALQQLCRLGDTQQPHTAASS